MKKEGVEKMLVTGAGVSVGRSGWAGTGFYTDSVFDREDTSGKPTTNVPLFYAMNHPTGSSSGEGWVTFGLALLPGQSYDQFERYEKKSKDKKDEQLDRCPVTFDIAANIGMSHLPVWLRLFTPVGS